MPEKKTKPKEKKQKPQRFQILESPAEITLNQDLLPNNGAAAVVAMQMHRELDVDWTSSWGLIRTLSRPHQSQLAGLEDAREKLLKALTDTSYRALMGMDLAPLRGPGRVSALLENGLGFVAEAQPPDATGKSPLLRVVAWYG